MAKRKQTADPVKILFIGNSFTARNDFPGLLARLAEARGLTVEHQLISAGGASLRAHWNAGTATEAIQKTHFDFVVLQEQSTLPIKNATRMHENIRLFDEAIKAAGSRTVLYLTWARRHAPESQEVLTEAYFSIGSALNALVVPVGLAWQSVLAQADHPVLHDKDDSHPTVAGSFLAACVFLGTLFGENPTGIALEIAGIEPKTMQMLEKAAWKASKSKTAIR
ncbi:DUF4886 domain-containing protein [soil metagenome]